MRAFLRLVAAAAFAAMALTPAQGREGPEAEAAFENPVEDATLAATTGKFLLPNGVELALSITSDTLVNGQAVLRTVLSVDQGPQQVRVYGRDGTMPASVPYPSAAAAAGATRATGVTVSFDRQSGIQTIAPVFAATAAHLSTADTVQDPAALGLVLLPLSASGPAVVTADGTVSLDAVRAGTQVTLAGDQYGVAHLVGPSVATALVNSGNDRTFDTVTNVSIDLRNAMPYQLGSAAMRVDTLALEATRGMVR